MLRRNLSKRTVSQRRLLVERLEDRCLLAVTQLIPHAIVGEPDANGDVGRLLARILFEDSALTPIGGFFAEGVFASDLVEVQVNSVPWVTQISSQQPSLSALRPPDAVLNWGNNEVVIIEAPFLTTTFNLPIIPEVLTVDSISTNPPTAIADQPFTVIVAGQGFTNESEIEILGNTTELSDTRFVSTSRLEATVSAPAGTLNVSVDAKGTQRIVVHRPPPTISSLDRELTPGILEYFVEGSNFAAGSIVWVRPAGATEYQQRPTSVDSSTELSFRFRGTDLQSSTQIEIYVENPGPGSERSHVLALTIDQPAPEVDGFSPFGVVLPGDPLFDLLIAGKNFADNAQVFLNDLAVEVVTGFFHSLLVRIPTDSFDQPQAANITVRNPIVDAPDKESQPKPIVFHEVSDRITATVDGQLGAPFVDQGDFVLNVSGAILSQHQPRSDWTIQWNGQSLATRVRGSSLLADIPGNFLFEAGYQRITAVHSDGTVTAPVTFTVLNPNTNFTGAPGNVFAGEDLILELTTFESPHIRGPFEFVDGAVLRLTGDLITGEYKPFERTPTTFKVRIPAEDIPAAAHDRTYDLTFGVFNPEPYGNAGGGRISVRNPAPQATAIDPPAIGSVISPDDQTTTFTISGSRFFDGLTEVRVRKAHSQFSAEPPPIILTPQVVNLETLVVEVPNDFLSFGGEIKFEVSNVGFEGSNSNLLHSNVIVEVTPPTPFIYQILPSFAQSLGDRTEPPIGQEVTLRVRNLVGAVNEESTTSIGLFGPGGPIPLTVGNGFIKFDGTLDQEKTTRSLAVDFNLVHPIVDISNVSPFPIRAGGFNETLTVCCSAYFLDGARAIINGQTVSATIENFDLVVDFPWRNFPAAGTYDVQVINGDGQISNQVSFEVITGKPVLTGLTPNRVNPNSPAFVTVNGRFFLQGSQVTFKGKDVATTYVNGHELTAKIEPGDFDAPGLNLINVVNPDGQSGDARFLQIFTPPWQNPAEPADVNGKDGVSALDALLVINEIRRRRINDEDNRLPDTRPNDQAFFDVGGDGFITALDALIVINTVAINAQTVGELAKSELEHESLIDDFHTLQVDLF